MKGGKLNKIKVKIIISAYSKEKEDNTDLKIN